MFQPRIQEGEGELSCTEPPLVSLTLGFHLGELNLTTSTQPSPGQNRGSLCLLNSLFGILPKSLCSVSGRGSNASWRDKNRSQRQPLQQQQHVWPDSQGQSPEWSGPLSNSDCPPPSENHLPAVLPPSHLGPLGKDWFSGQALATLQRPPANSPGSAKELSPKQLAPITQNQLEAFGWGEAGLQNAGLGTST